MQICSVVTKDFSKSQHQGSFPSCETAWIKSIVLSTFEELRKIFVAIIFPSHFFTQWILRCSIIAPADPISTHAWEVAPWEPILQTCDTFRNLQSYHHVHCILSTHYSTSTCVHLYVCVCVCVGVCVCVCTMGRALWFKSKISPVALLVSVPAPAGQYVWIKRFIITNWTGVSWMPSAYLLSGELEWIIMIDTSTQAGSSLLPDRLTQLTKIAGLFLTKTLPTGSPQTGTTNMSLNISLILMRPCIWLLGKLRRATLLIFLSSTFKEICSFTFLLRPLSFLCSKY